MPGYQAALDTFAGFDAQVVGISVDSVYSHIAWQKSLGGLSYPLASDFYPHGATAGLYGILRSQPPIPGVSERAIFIVDKDGRVADARIYDLSTVPDNAELWESLRRLKETQLATG